MSPVFKAEDYMINDATVREVRRESARAIQKHGREKTAISPNRTRLYKLSILTEEIGEVAKTINEFELGNLTTEQFVAELKKELTQVSSVAAMWLECETENTITGG